MVYAPGLRRGVYSLNEILHLGHCPFDWPFGLHFQAGDRGRPGSGVLRRTAQPPRDIGRDAGIAPPRTADQFLQTEGRFAVSAIGQHQHPVAMREHHLARSPSGNLGRSLSGIGLARQSLRLYRIGFQNVDMGQDLFLFRPFPVSEGSAVG